MGTALITGASSGLGLEYAWQLATDGHDLVLVSRRRDRLEAIANEIRNVAGVHVEVMARDLADRSQLGEVAARLERAERPVGLLINNAGFGLGKAFTRSALREEEHALDVMVRSVLVLSHAAARAMTSRGRGAILNVSSVAQGTAMGSYAAHKAWVRAFTEGLATELAGTGVTATAVLPGLVRTEFHATARMNAEVWPEQGWIPAAAVVDESLSAVRRGKVLSVPTIRYKVAVAFLAIAPRRLVRAVTGSRTHRKSHGSHDRAE